MNRLLALASGIALLGAAFPAFARTTDSQFVSIKVSVTPLASRTLMKVGEQITVSAEFYAKPARAGQEHVNQIGQIALARREQTLPATGGIVHFRLANIPPRQLRWIAGQVRVNANVYSARRHFRDNVLACDFLDGTAPRSGRAPVALRCGLIREHLKTRAIG